MNKTEYVRAQIKIPRDVSEWLTARALADCRSKNSMLNVMLREMMQRDVENKNAPPVAAGEAGSAF